MKRTMILATIFLLHLPKLSFAQSAPLLGFAAVEKKLTARTMMPPNTFSFYSYVLSSDLLKLMGTYDGGFGTSAGTFLNGKPNAINFLLYYEAFWKFGNVLGRSCEVPNSYQNPQFLAALSAVCQWPAASARSEATLKKFWLSLMGYDAPETEFIAWRDHFLNSPKYAGASAEVVIPAMTATLLLNPHFLLTK